MAAPRRGPRCPTNRGKWGFDNRSDTWPKLNVVSSSPWSSQSNFEPHVSFANNIAISGRCAPRYLRGASRSLETVRTASNRKRNHPRHREMDTSRVDGVKAPLHDGTPRYTWLHSS